jgi:hypothetical protein
MVEQSYHSLDDGRHIRAYRPVLKKPEGKLFNDFARANAVHPKYVAP